MKAYTRAYSACPGRLPPRKTLSKCATTASSEVDPSQFGPADSKNRHLDVHTLAVRTVWSFLCNVVRSDLRIPSTCAKIFTARERDKVQVSSTAQWNEDFSHYIRELWIMRFGHVWLMVGSSEAAPQKHQTFRTSFDRFDRAPVMDQC